MATKARFWLARFWGARFWLAKGATAAAPAAEPAVSTAGGASGRRIPRHRLKLNLSFPLDELEERRFQARLPRLKREDEMLLRSIKDFLKGIG